MAHHYVERMLTFTEDSLPDLNEVVLGALTFLETTAIPAIDVTAYKRPLVIGSVGGLNTARILFEGTDALVADESSYMPYLEPKWGVDGIYIVSASGSKHAVGVASSLSTLALPVHLITSTRNAPASSYVSPERVCIFPHIREPYTYNTSTYLAYILGVTGESPATIRTFIEASLGRFGSVPFGAYTSFVLVVPPQFGNHRVLFTTKFDEMLAPVVTGRAFTSEELKHAKLVIPSKKQYIINLGTDTTPYVPESQQLSVPLPESCGPAACMAIGYYLIGLIQRAHPPYFKEHIRAYTTRAAEVFGQTVPVIVE